MKLSHGLGRIVETCRMTNGNGDHGTSLTSHSDGNDAAGGSGGKDPKRCEPWIGDWGSG